MWRGEGKVQVEASVLMKGGRVEGARWNMKIARTPWKRKLAMTVKYTNTNSAGWLAFVVVDL